MTLRYADMFGSSGIRATTASHQRPLVADFRMPLGAVSEVESADHSSFGTLKVHVLGRAPCKEAPTNTILR